MTGDTYKLVQFNFPEKDTCEEVRVLLGERTMTHRRHSCIIMSVASSHVVHFVFKTARRNTFITYYGYVANKAYQCGRRLSDKRQFMTISAYLLNPQGYEKASEGPSSI